MKKLWQVGVGQVQTNPDHPRHGCVPSSTSIKKKDKNNPQTTEVRS